MKFNVKIRVRNVRMSACSPNTAGIVINCRRRFFGIFVVIFFYGVKPGKFVSYKIRMAAAAPDGIFTIFRDYTTAENQSNVTYNVKMYKDIYSCGVSRGGRRVR